MPRRPTLPCKEQPCFPACRAWNEAGENQHLLRSLRDCRAGRDAASAGCCAALDQPGRLAQVGQEIAEHRLWPGHQQGPVEHRPAQYGGAGQYNLLNDRDFVAASIKYSF